MRLCGIIGHKWNKEDQYHQDCTRRGCYAFRYVYYKRFPKFGEPQTGWTILDMNNLKFK